MRKLPKYAVLTGEGLVGVKIIQLERPYIIASVFDLNKEDYERISEMQEIKLNEREPIAKVNGYAIWLRPLSSLEPNNDFYYTEGVLNEMADYFLKTKIAAKPGVYRRSDESGKAEQRHEFIKEMAMRERRPRIKKED